MPPHSDPLPLPLSQPPTPSSAHLNATLRAALQERTPHIEWKLWLHDLNLHSQKKNVFFFHTPSPVKQLKIQNTYLPLINEILQCHSPFPHPNIQIITNPKNFVPVTPTPPPPKNLSDTPHSPSNLPTISFEHSLKNFIPTDATRIAYDFCHKVTHQLGAVSPLYLYGPVGIGKTHLLHAVGKHFQDHFPFLKIQCIDPNDFVSEFTQALSLGTDRPFRLKYRSLDVLLIDDVQFFTGKEKSCLEFFHIFNAINAPHKKQMIFCSDRNPDEIHRIDERLKSRLASSAVIEISPLSTADKVILTQHFSHVNRLQLDKEILHFIAEHVPSDVRKIQGALQTLTLLHDLYGLPITLNLVQKNLKQLHFKDKNQPTTPEKILLTLSQYTNIPLNQLRSHNRSRSTAHTRQIAMFLLREHSSLSIAEIGQLLGGKTPSTVSSSIQKIKLQVQSHPPTQRLLHSLLQRL